MRYQGKITSWKDDQGFGFITTNSCNDRIFVHISAFKNRKRRPAANEIVTYDAETDPKGRMRAENVAFVGDYSPAASSHDRRSISLILAIFFILFVVAATLSEMIHVIVLALYIGTSFIAFIVYAFDKSAAQNDRWRTDECTLHFLGLIGGWPGALAAQRFLRHKSKKQSFQSIFWITILLNCAGFIWLLTHEGSGTLNSILSY